MLRTIRSIVAISILGLGIVPASAHINPERLGAYNPKDKPVGLRNDCAQATSQIDMNINNVRARLLNGGDVWWDLQDGSYIVPNVQPGSGIPEVSAIFAGAVWVGGLDDVGNLKMAAQDYRTDVSTDFWPGPLTNIGTTAFDTCKQWDQFFRVLGSDIRNHVRDFRAAQEAGVSLECDDIPVGLRGWPGKGNPYFFEIYGWDLPFDTQGLGAFHDEDKDGLYDPCSGDYPVIEIRGCDAPNFPDEMIFWIYNDNGNIHTNSEGDPIRMEIQVQAFAYATNDEINDMTFQRYKLINRAVSRINETYFAMWIDPDLGCFTDDYIGCDTATSLMYVYNEDALDGTTQCDCPSGSGPVNTYCRDVPILGVDYFRGPRVPTSFRDTFPIDWTFDPANNGTPTNLGYDIIRADSMVALTDTSKLVFGEERKEVGMSSFTYYNNPGTGNPDPATTDPQGGAPLQFYNYISGRWRDGTPFTEGGSGYNIPAINPIKYAFPDPPSDASGWSMCTANLDFGDRRTLQATGPLRLDPGEVNELIIGAVWVPDIDYPCPDITRLLSADGLAQALFDNCFEIPRGPDAPDLDFIELDRELVLILTNDSLGSNNAFELYREKGLEIPPQEEDSLYVFEGYKVYQLAGPDVGLSEVDNIDRARLVIQVDVKNGVNTLYNWSSIPNPDPNNSEVIWIPEQQVQGADEGIRHTFQLREDQFGSDDRRLVNHKKYYYTAVAYGYNNYTQFDPRDIVGQRQPYLEGRLNIKTYTPIPRPITYAMLNSFYGQGALITGLGGQGAGGNLLDITDETREAIAINGSVDEIDYLPNSAPIEVKVYDPLRVKNGSYILEFVDGGSNSDTLSDLARWRMYPEDDPDDVIVSERTIARAYEQIIPERGFSVLIGQTDDVGDKFDATNGTLGMALEYAEVDGPQWFTAVPDNGAPFNFIKTLCPDEPDCGLDVPGEPLSKIGGGMFAPFQIMDYRRTGFQLNPIWLNNNQQNVRLRPDAAIQNLNNVDIVFTSNKDLWSRCIVVESTNAYFDGFGLRTEGDSENFDYRDTPSVGKEDTDGDGRADPDGSGTTGYGWFPGYAVDVETGKRLNIFFGEASVYTPELSAATNGSYPPNGNDMIWNPTSDVFTESTGEIPDFSMGGMHYIYVTHQEYDGCAGWDTRLRPGPSGAFFKQQVLDKVTWASMPIVAQGEELLSYNDGLIPNDLTIKIRVDNPYDVTYDDGGNRETPKYRIILDGVEAEDLADGDEINAALAKISVVPNPYYAYSTYEVSQFSNVVKITNLPAECDVTIFSIDGRFIRSYKRNEVGVPNSDRTNPPFEQGQILPDLEWDLRNHAGIPIASGVYLIHVNAPGLGERVIKWFGVSRKFDPSGL